MSEEVTLNSTKDNWITSSAKTTNNGSDDDARVINYLEHPTFAKAFGFFSFVVNSLVDETLISATLRLWVYSNDRDGQTIKVRKIQSAYDSWVENQMTYQVWKTGSSWAGGDFSSSDYITSDPDEVNAVAPSGTGVWMEWNALELLQDALDNSINLNVVVMGTSPGTSTIRFSTKEATASLRPQLVIAYYTAPPSTYPTDAITRVTSLIHRYNRAEGIYNLEIGLGETDVNISMPDYGLTSTSASPAEQAVVASDVVVNKAIDAVKKTPAGSLSPTERVSVGLPPIPVTPTTTPTPAPVYSPFDTINKFTAELRKNEPAALTERTIGILRNPANQQAINAIEAGQAAERLKTGNIASERTKAIITSSPAAQKRLADIEEESKSWWQKLW